VRPQVSVEVEQYRSQNVYVMGEVKNPGTYPLTGGMTILDLIARAGSLTSSAGGTVLIHRPRGGRGASGPVTGSNSDDVETIRLSVRDLQTGRAGQGIVLRDGDTIFVPKAATFYVTGHVRTPGPYVLEGELTVMQALSLAGGVTERGAANRVKIIRLVDGRQREIRAKPTDLVQPGDTIHVPQRFF
jgi:polysaccharide export outer membrane protein